DSRGWPALVDVNARQRIDSPASVVGAQTTSQGQAPAFDVVAGWRDEQERALRRRRAPHAMDAAALVRFVAHYERLSRHALRTLPILADVLVALDRRRKVRSVSAPARRGSSRARTARC
ncbi:MAG: hypothetical protein J0L88_15180, partial [Xanthomonadales bacterium]|nr:hypothetical protein [Xanthomonadales bacterium]